MMKQSKANWLDYVRNYRFHSIFIRIMLLILVVLIIPSMSVLFISYYSYEHIYESESKAYTDKVNTMIMKDVEGLFAEFQEKAILLSMDDDVQVFFHLADDRLGYDYTKIQDYIAMYKVSSNVVDDIYLYSPRSQYVHSSAGRSSYSTFFDKECLDRWNNAGELQQYEYLNRPIYRADKENICLYYNIQYGAGTTGVIVFQLNMNDLRKMFHYDENIDLIVVGKQKVIYDSTNTCLGTEIADVDEITAKLEGGIVTTTTIDFYNIDLILHINKASLDESVNKIGAFLAVFSGAMLLITIALAFYLSQKITNPLTEILNILKENPGNHEAELLQNKDEVSFIMKSISSTMSRNKDVEEELRERIWLLKKAQAVALQAQINPHFLNNTLENINWMAISRLGGGNDISEMLNCLSSLLHGSLGDTDTFITFNDEISYVRKYLFIQQKRFDNKFDVIWDVENGLESCRIIKLILQPVVENAINYGIKPYDGKGTIEIEAYKTEDRVRIIVKDSGLGLSAQEVESINESIRRTVIKESDHIGLSNVNQRLILAFGESYGVTVSSEIGEGTSVMIELPHMMQ